MAHRLRCQLETLSKLVLSEVVEIQTPFDIPDDPDLTGAIKGDRRDVLRFAVSVLEALACGCPQEDAILRGSKEDLCPIAP